MVQSMLATEDLFRRMSHWVRDIVFRLDARGRIVFISLAVSRFGYAPEALLGRSILELIHPDHREPCRESFVARRTGGHRPAGLRVWLLRKDADPTTRTTHPVFILDAEGIYAGSPSGARFQGTIGILRDVTLHHAAKQRLRRAVIENKLLLRELQHRVGNHLQLLLSLTELTAERVQSPEAMSVCREIRGYVRCVHLIHSLLSRDKAAEAVDLGEMALQLFHFLAAVYRMDGIQPAFRLEPVTVHMDKAIPCGMLLNELLSNIFKHAYPEGRGVVEMELTRTRGGLVVLYVADKGKGLPDCGGKVAEKGMGMGLVRSLAGQLRADWCMTNGDGLEVALAFYPEVTRKTTR